MTYVVHEFLARNADLLGQRGAEHHDLLVVRGDPEDFLNVAAHICRSKMGCCSEGECDVGRRRVRTMPSDAKKTGE